jgi:predicted lysophospholipase L1 biosynthesis ABC-type transport system permease subunit
VADVRAEAADQAHARQARVYVVVGVCCLLIALVSLATSYGHQRIRRRTETAALRVIGVDVAAALRAGRVELAFLAAAMMVGGVLGGAVACWLLLDRFLLVDFPVYSVPLDTGIGLWILVVAALVMAGAVLGIGSRALAGQSHDSAPSILREEGEP